MTLTKAIALLGKRVWTVFVLSPQYGRVQRGIIYHVTIHAEKVKRGEWHAYVSTASGGMDYAPEDLYLTKEEAESEMKRRMLKDGE